MYYLLDRDIKVVRPLYSVEVIETETARFETEISEEDVHANWKLKGEALHPSPVSLVPFTTNIIFDFISKLNLKSTCEKYMLEGAYNKENICTLLSREAVYSGKAVSRSDYP